MTAGEISMKSTAILKTICVRTICFIMKMLPFLELISKVESLA